MRPAQRQAAEPCVPHDKMESCDNVECTKPLSFGMKVSGNADGTVKMGRYTLSTEASYYRNVRTPRLKLKRLSFGLEGVKGQSSAVKMNTCIPMIGWSTSSARGAGIQEAAVNESSSMQEGLASASVQDSRLRLEICQH